MLSRSWSWRRSGRRSTSTATGRGRISAAPAPGVSRLARGGAGPARRRSAGLPRRTRLGHYVHLGAAADRGGAGRGDRHDRPPRSRRAWRGGAGPPLERRTDASGNGAHQPSALPLGGRGRPSLRAAARRWSSRGRGRPARGIGARRALRPPPFPRRGSPVSRTAESRALLLAFRPGGRLCPPLLCRRRADAKDVERKDRRGAARVVRRGRRGEDPGPSLHAHRRHAARQGQAAVHAAHRHR